VTWGNDELHSGSLPFADTDGSLAQTTTGNTPLPGYLEPLYGDQPALTAGAGMWVEPGRKELRGLSG
jgi:hypothetical protein